MASPSSSLLPSGGSNETPSAFYFHKVFFLEEETHGCGPAKKCFPPRPSARKLLVSRFGFLVYRHVTKEATFPVMTKPMEKQDLGKCALLIVLAPFSDLKLLCLETEMWRV